jgi:hypothetical protein
MSEELVWYDKEIGSESRQWYFNEEPCDVLRIGVEDGKVEVIEIKTAAGVVRQVNCADDGSYPGLAFDDTVH